MQVGEMGGIKTVERQVKVTFVINNSLLDYVTLTNRHTFCFAGSRPQCLKTRLKCMFSDSLLQISLFLLPF